MQSRPRSLSGTRYCGSRVVASPLKLSSTDPYAKKAGQPFGQPFADASPVGILLVCSTVTYAFVANGPVNCENMVAIAGWTWPRGESVCWKVLPICDPVRPSKSLTKSVVVENCDAFTRPMLPR